MNKSKANILIDILLFFSAIIVSVSGCIIWFGSSSFLGVAKPLWKDIHKFTSVILIVLIVIHLVLHWCWIKCIPKMLK